MKALVKATFEFDVTEWVAEDGEDVVKDELHDFSVFMPKAEYENLNDVDVELVPTYSCVECGNPVEKHEPQCQDCRVSY